MDVEVDRRGIAPVAAEAYVPPRDLRVVLDGLDERLLRDVVLEVAGDQIVLRLPLGRRQRPTRVMLRNHES